MNCQNCGAPMNLVRHRDYFFCEYCGSFFFPPESGEGVRVLSDDPRGLQCPVCRQLLAQAALDEIPALYCRECHGVLIEQQRFGALVEVRRSSATGVGRPPRQLEKTELERHVRCPQCQRSMETHPYLGPGNVVIDTCASCHLVWLDPGELAAIVEAPGSDRGGRLKLDWLEGQDQDTWLEKSLKRRGKL